VEMDPDEDLPWSNPELHPCLVGEKQKQIQKRHPVSASSGCSG
jgi:hypothetical protein